MMEIELKGTDKRIVWENIENEESIKIFFDCDFHITGRWRVNGGGKPYHITHPEL